MLTIELCGGLGNQLYQIFTTIALAIKTNQSFFFTYTENHGSEFLNETVRITYWNTLLKNLNKYTTLEPTTHYKSNTFSITEVNHSYHPMPFINLDNTDLFVLVGYFQSYKYFENEFQEIYEMIGFDEIKKNVGSSNPKLSSSMSNDKNSISMHFRLGDYKSRIDWHPIMEVNYYKKSLDAILSKTHIDSNQDINVFYFCEEEDIGYIEYLIDEIKRHVSCSLWKNLKYTFTYVSSNIPDWQQLILMYDES